MFDCSLKSNYQILIIFGMNISDATCRQTTIQLPTTPNVLFLHYLEKAEPAKYHFLCNEI